LIHLLVGRIDCQRDDRGILHGLIDLISGSEGIATHARAADMEMSVWMKGAIKQILTEIRVELNTKLEREMTNIR
jgi:hypothetical protein